MFVSYLRCAKYEHIFEKYQSYLSHFTSEVEPQTYCEAAKHPRWVEAMQLEIKALEYSKT